MKTLIGVALIALLAGCSSMGMHQNSSGGTNATGSSAAGDDYYKRDDGSHSWIN